LSYASSQASATITVEEKMPYKFIVKDAETNQPVEGALCRLVCQFPPGGTIPYEGHTNIDGVCEIDTQGMTALYWSVEKAGYEKAGGEKPGQTINVNLVRLAPAKGTLECHAYEDSKQVEASVTVTDVGTYTTPFTLELNPGSYSLTCTYLGKTQSKTVTIESEKWTLAEFKFAVTPPPAPIQTSLTIQAPKSVMVNESFTVSGELTRVDTGEGIPNQPVNIYYNTSKIGSTTTMSNGAYSASCAIPKSGTFTLKAEFPSSATYAASVVASTLTVAKFTGPFKLWPFPLLNMLLGFRDSKFVGKASKPVQSRKETIKTY
jgi:hypothetical protein